jgi:ABC-2 type transport system permease protein
MNTTRLKTLVLREWLQHRIGWLGVMLLPLAIALVAMPFSLPIERSEFKVSELNLGGLHPATVAALALWGFSAIAVVALTILAQLFQVSGLARRDAQDRSLEFWMSLPGSHSEHLAVTILSHTLLVLLIAVGVGAVSGLLIALLGIVKAFGFAGLAQAQWGLVLQFLTPGLVRLVAGLPLFVLWLLPMVLVLMAASAWLKRWGAPAVVIGTVVLGNLPATRGPVREWLMALMERIDGAFFPDNLEQLRAAGVEVGKLSFNEVEGFWRLIGLDLTHQLGQLATPMFVSVAVLSAACFAALVYRRQHHL